MDKNRKGFTLIELVVVMTIIGILAAILVPTMMGYIRKSRLKTSNASAKVAYNVLTGTIGKYLCDDKISEVDCVGMEIDCRGSTPKPENNDFAKSIYESLTQNGEGAGIMYIGEFDTSASQDGKNKSYFVHWIVSPGDEMVGQYPDAAYDVEEAPLYKTFKPAS